MASKKKAAVPPTDDSWTIRVLFPGKFLGVTKAREASEVFAIHGVKTRVIPESRTMILNLPKKAALSALNADLAKMGLGLVKSEFAPAAYEWQFKDPK